MNSYQKVKNFIFNKLQIKQDEERLMILIMK